MSASPVPLSSVNPILQEIDAAHANLSPQAKAAIEGAHGVMGLRPPSTDQAMPTAVPDGIKSPVSAPTTTVAPTSEPAQPVAPIRSPLGPALSLGGQQPQPQSAAQSNVNHLQSSPSGVAGIRSPWARIPLQILDAVGGAVAPALEQLLPGTEGHHNLLVREAQGNRAAEDTSNEAAAREGLQNAQTAGALETTAEQEAAAPGSRAHTAAETTELGARGTHETAEAEALKNPKAEAGTVHEDAQGNMWVVHPDGSATAVSPKGGDQLKGKTTEEKTGTVHEDGNGNMWIVKGDGTATPVKANGTQLKGKPPVVAKETPEQQFIDEYQKTHGGSVADAQRAFEKNRQLPPQADRGQNFVDPTTHKLVRVEPGGAVPEGAVTAGGLSTETIAGDKDQKAAVKAREDAAKEYSLAEKLVATPSPTNDVALIMRYIGATKPDSLGKLRLNQNEIQLVTGTRSTLGDIEALAEKVQNGQKLTPDQRKDMLATMKILAGDAVGGGGAKSINTKAEYDALPKGSTYVDAADGKTYKKR